jgi:hypothetical protein
MRKAATARAALAETALADAAVAEAAVAAAALAGTALAETAPAEAGGHRAPLHDRGSAAAETALVLPGVVLLMACLLSCAVVVQAQVRCLDAARSAARLAARGESAQAVQQAALSVAPRGASVQVSPAADTVGVEVRASVRLLLPGAPDLAVRAVVTAPREQAGPSAVGP